MDGRAPSRLRSLVGALVVVLGLAALASAALAPADAALKKPAPKAAAVAASDCGTTVVKKADGTPWVCTFGDEFTGTKLDTSKWAVQLTATSGFTSGGECFVNTAQSVSQLFGVLKLTARKLPKPMVCTSPRGNFSTSYTSGTINTFGTFSQAYGRFEIRAKFPTGRVPGTQSSLWLYPQDVGPLPWPYSGEIDLAEWYSQYPDLVIPFLHHGLSYIDPTSTNTTCRVTNTAALWHTYVLEWTPQAIKIIYDGKTCLQNTTYAGTVPFNKAYMIVLSQLIGVGSNAPTARTVLPATTQIDYVHVWQ